MMYNYWPGYGGFDFIGSIVSFIIWLFVIIVVFRFISHRRHWLSEDKEQSPIDILKTRYAKGEIDKTEYDEKMKVITDQQASNQER